MMKCQIESGNAALCGGMERKWLVLHMETDLRFNDMGRIPWRSVRRCSGTAAPAGLELCEEDIQKLLDRENRDSLNLRHPAKKLIK